MELKPVRTEDQNFGRTTYGAQDAAYTTPQGQKVLRNTYLLLAVTMVPTVIGAFIGAKFLKEADPRRRLLAAIAMSIGVIALALG